MRIANHKITSMRFDISAIGHQDSLPLTENSPWGNFVVTLRVVHRHPICGLHRQTIEPLHCQFREDIDRDRVSNQDTID